ncbi:MAG TPA: Hsp70 family protein [Acidimicrobiia bacterium]|nr:Hsp70 family protein [Acidimicrobiia bacterium]
MGYFVGIDLGTTFTAAAVFRDGGQPETVQLGNRGASIPSTVFLRDDDTVLTGHAALRRGMSDPSRLARQFKRRFGDPTPLLLGGVPVSADALTGRMLRATVEAVTEREGSAPDAVAVCHPANWGPYKLDLLSQACRHAGLEGAMTVNEPEAAAVHYAAQERPAPEARVAVYDLGGGTFDAAVLRRTDDGFEILGSPDGIERLGGIDFDEAVVAHVRNAVGEALAALDPDDPTTISTLARLRDECVEAKEALSGDTEASVPVVLPGLVTEVRITRVEFEGMIRVPLSETIESLRRALRSAAVEPEDLAAVLLVGGSSRIPMVAEMVGAELGRPVAVDADPKHVVALGAARVAARSRVPVGAGVPAAPEIAPTAPSVPPEPPAPPRPAREVAKPKAKAPAPVPPAPKAPGSTNGGGADDARSTPSGPGPRRPRKGVLVGVVAGAAVLALAVGALALSGGGGGGGEEAADDGGGEVAAADGFITECPPAGDPAVCITDVGFVGNDLSVEFTDHDVQLGGNLVPIFFLTDISENEADSVTDRTGDWQAWGPNSPFEGTNESGQSGFTDDETGSRRAVCVLIGDIDGNVAAGTGNCAELPS